MKPILFTKENRDKTRSGAKTQTRRVITDTLPTRARFDSHGDGGRGWEEVNEQGNATESYFEWRAPYVLGEVRYMCEPYEIHTYGYMKDRQVIGEYIDDGKPFDVVLTPAEWDRWQARKRPYDVTPARFMYRSLARTFVEISDLRREPLQEISEADAESEGCAGSRCDHAYRDEHGCTDCYGSGWLWTPQLEYMDLWDSINGKRPGCTWDDNPTVLVVEYKLVTP